jgi:hypothetical protein
MLCRSMGLAMPSSVRNSVGFGLRAGLTFEIGLRDKL